MIENKNDIYITLKYQIKLKLRSFSKARSKLAKGSSDSNIFETINSCH